MNQKVLSFCAAMLFSIVSYAQTATPPGAGDGSEANPYEIASLQNLYWLSLSDTAWDKHYVQTVDIDASKTIGWNSGAGFMPIATYANPFFGSYNGRGHVIDQLYINRPSASYVGLFSRLSNAEIDSLGVTNVNISAESKVAALAGRTDGGAVSFCYSTGEVNTGSGNWIITGGLIGTNQSILNCCYSSVNVNSSGHVAGGLVGRNVDFTAPGKIYNSYATGSVSGSENVGGLVGNNGSEIRNCYSIGAVSGSQNVGGLVGFKYSSDPATVNNSYWDTETSGRSSSIGGSGRTTAEMTLAMNYLVGGWDFIAETINGIDDNWSYNINENGGYPSLAFQGFSTSCAPITQASNIYHYDIQTESFYFGSFGKTQYLSADGYVVFMHTEDEWSIPSGEEIPTGNPVWQNAGQQCIFESANINPESELITVQQTISGLTEDTKYFIKIYAYNICDGVRYYESSGYLVELRTPVPSEVPVGEGTEEAPYQIATLENLAWMMYEDQSWNKHFIQTADINAAPTIEWFDSAGFRSVGTISTHFEGIYNGKGYRIDSLFINRTEVDRIGLFSQIGDNGVVDILHLTNVSIKGNKIIGALAGFNHGSVRNCSATGEIVGENDHIGGLIGVNRSKVDKCFTNVNVQGRNSIGGFVGNSEYSEAEISNCYSHGTITGNDYVGGFIGYNDAKTSLSYSIGIVNCTNSVKGGFSGYSTNTILNCFFDSVAVGINSSNGGIGLSTEEMKSVDTYLAVGFDFIDETINGEIDNWGMNTTDNSGYPFLSWQGFENTAVLGCVAPLTEVKDIYLNIRDTEMIVDSLENFGYGTVGYAIYINSEALWVAPAENEEPTASTEWQNAGQQCVYFGTDQKPAVQISALLPETTYYIHVYSYNNCSETKLWEQDGLNYEFETQISFSVPLGTGSEEDPYVISSIEELTWLMLSDTAWDKNYIQAAYINLKASENWNNGTGFSPIGNEDIRFTGTYNGKGYTIDSLSITRPNDQYIGLFGFADIGAHIDSLSVTNYTLSGLYYIGGVVGSNKGTVSNCYSSGSGSSGANAYLSLGGLVGVNQGLISRCGSNSNLTALVGGNVGGLVGQNVNENAVIEYSYSLGNSRALAAVGGLVGRNKNFALIRDSYARGNAVAAGTNASYSGGIVGRIEADAIILRCFSTGRATAVWDKGGIVGYNVGGFVRQSFWDKQTSLNTTSVGGIGLTTIEMKNVANYLNAGWDFANENYNGTDDSWGINDTDNDGYPFLAWQGFESDNLCMAPISAATDFVISNYQSSSILLESFTPAGYGTAGYVIFLNNENVWTDPVENENPTVNTTWQNGGQQCIYNGTSDLLNLTVNGLDLCNGESNYYLKVYAYSTCTGGRLYESLGLNDSILTGDAIAPIPDVAELPDLVGQCSIEVTEVPTASDNCAGVITATTINPLEYNVQGMYVVTWSYDDGNGNVITQNQNVIVEDNTAPMANLETLSDVVGICSAIVTETPSATDNCSGNIIGTTTDPLEYTEQGSYIVTWSYTDIEGNISTQEQNVIVLDEIAPVADLETLSEVVGQCSAEVTEVPTATDNCSGAITGTTTDPLEYTEQGTYTVTWSYTDAYGNVSTQEQTVIVLDNTAPIADLEALPDVVGVCSASVIETPTATDNCSGAIVGTTNDPLEYTEQGSFTLTWTFTDAHGNVSNQQQTVVVTDDVDPIITCMANQEIEISTTQTSYMVSGVEFDPTEINDNCNVASVLNNFNNTESLNGAELPIGTTTIVWTVTDDAGNSAECSFDVEVSQIVAVDNNGVQNISVYPNPTAHNLTINLSGIMVEKVEITDVAGNTIYSTHNAQPVEVVNLTDYADGLYFVIVKTNNGNVIKKVIKQD